MNKWQPIDTAPKDGNEVLIYYRNEWDEFRITVASYQPYNDAGYPYLWVNSHGDSIYRPWKLDMNKEERKKYGPLYWQPLPEPPTP